MRAGLMLVLAVWCAAGCREGAGVYEPTSEPLAGDLRQLTFNDHAEYAPSFSRTSDSIYYSTGDFLSHPRHARALLRVSLEGGPAQLVAGSAQSVGLGGAPVPPLAAPVPSPDGERLAYVQLFCHDTSREVADSPYSCVNRFAVLDSAVVRVRSMGSTGFAQADPGVVVHGGSLDALWFRPSWSPDGREVAIADGTALRVWRLADNTLTTIAGTQNAASAAWHPSAGTIAFERNGVIALVELQSGVIRELTAGAQPAWSPDGVLIYLRGANGIHRVPVAGGAVEVVPNTIGGRSPALSPDGGWLAFTRTKPVEFSTDHDLWLLRLR